MRILLTVCIAFAALAVIPSAQAQFTIPNYLCWHNPDASYNFCVETVGAYTSAPVPTGEYSIQDNGEECVLSYIVCYPDYSVRVDSEPRPVRIPTGAYVTVEQTETCEWDPYSCSTTVGGEVPI